MEQLLNISTQNASTLTMSSREIAELTNYSLPDLLRSEYMEKALNGELGESATLNVALCLLAKLNEETMSIHSLCFKAIEDSDIAKSIKLADSIDLLRSIAAHATDWFKYNEFLSKSFSVCNKELYHIWIELILISTPSTDNRNSKTTKTYIVFNPTSQLIKIGKSISPKSRIRNLQMQAGSIFEVLALIDSDLESELHKKFAEYRTVGEWFEDRDGVIREYAKTLN